MKLKYVEEFRLLYTDIKKVSFDVALFKKELEKALNFLTPNEQHVLRMWVNEFVSDRQDLQIVISN